MIINAVVEPKKYETLYGLINRFNKLVESEGILKDYKLSKMTKKDRKIFKKFSSERRRTKQLKRIETILNET